MKSPHVSPQLVLSNDIQNMSENSPTRSSGSLKSHWTRKGDHLYKKITRVEDKGYYSSVYYKGLIGPVTGPEANSMSAITHKLENLNASSPYYRGLLFQSCSTGRTTTTTTAKHELKKFNISSPYYKGLL